MNNKWHGKTDRKGERQERERQKRKRERGEREKERERMTDREKWKVNTKMQRAKFNR